jgi:mitogen-activated protein kinase 1/3
MITFDPEKRWTVEQCLKHPYFEGLHNPEEEPVCEKAFDWNWDSFEPTGQVLRTMVYDESLSFHPNK